MGVMCSLFLFLYYNNYNYNYYYGMVFFTDGDFNCTLCYGRKRLEWNDKCKVWW